MSFDLLNIAELGTRTTFEVGFWVGVSVTGSFVGVFEVVPNDGFFEGNDVIGAVLGPIDGFLDGVIDGFEVDGDIDGDWDGLLDG